MSIRIAALAAMTTLMGGAAMAASSSPLFYGYESYNINEKLGWYSVTADGATAFRWVDHSGSTGIPMTSGWRREGRLCGISSLLAEGKLYALNYVELNEENGDAYLVEGIDMEESLYLNYYLTAAYISKTDRVYGYGWSAGGDAYVFKSSAYNITDTKAIRTVRPDEVCASLCYNEDTGALIGYNRKSFVSIDPATGQQTAIFTPDVPGYTYTNTALAYDPESGLYYWSVVTNNSQSHMYAVDMERKTLTPVCDYYDMTIFSFMLPASESGDPTAPAKPEFESSSFPQGALSGTVTFRLPGSTVAGETLSENLSWTATIDGVMAAEGNASPGTLVTFEAKDLTQGMHSFAVRVTAGDKTSRQGVWNGFIGLDTPAAPASVKLEGVNLTWDAVTIGANEGYIDPAAVSYTVYLNGQLQGTTSATSYTVTFPEDKPYAVYQASVTATFDGKVSEAGMSQQVRYGNPVALPVDFNPTTAEAALFETVDAKNAGAVWTYDSSASGRENFSSPISEGKAVDSWLFMPPVATADADGVYEFSIRAALNDAAHNDGTFEVMAGTAPAPEAMTTTVIAPIDLRQTSIKEFKGVFSPASMGGTDRVYIGIRAKSESGDYRVMARRFIVKATNMKATVAAAPVIKSIEAGEEGDLNAKVTVILPSTSMNGEALPAGTKVTANVKCDYFSATAEGNPGETVSTEVRTNQGENYLTVTSSVNGENGAYTTGRVYTGMAIPNGVTNLQVKVAEDNLSCDVTWDEPEDAISEGFFAPELVQYYYCTYNSSTGDYTPDTNLGNYRSHTIEAPSPTKLTNVNFAIQSRSTAGSSPVLVGERVQLGKPYDLPMDENFYNMMTSQRTMNYTPITLQTSGDYANTTWALRDPAEVNEAYAHTYPTALVGSGETGSVGYLQLPKFSTKGMDDAGVEMGIYGEATTPAVTIWGYSAGQAEPVTIGTLSNYSQGKYVKYSFKLPESLQNQGWVTLYLTPEYNVRGTLVINSYRVAKGITGVSMPTAEATGLRAFADKGSLTLLGDCEARVVTLDGRIVWSGNVEGETTIRLNPAIYIVSGEGKSLKVTVK